MLERKSAESGNSPGKLGLFSVALVVCVCCFTSFFQPLVGNLEGANIGKNQGMGYLNLPVMTGQTLKSYEIDEEKPQEVAVL